MRHAMQSASLDNRIRSHLCRPRLWLVMRILISIARGTHCLTHIGITARGLDRGTEQTAIRLPVAVLLGEPKMSRCRSFSIELD